MGYSSARIRSTWACASAIDASIDEQSESAVITTASARRHSPTFHVFEHGEWRHG